MCEPAKLWRQHERGKTKGDEDVVEAEDSGIPSNIQSAHERRDPSSRSVQQTEGFPASDATKTHEWRLDQLDRLIRMLKDNYQRFADASRKEFKTASQENAFEVSATIATSEFAKSQLKEWMRLVDVPTGGAS